MDEHTKVSEEAGCGGPACALRELRQKDYDSKANGYTVSLSQRGKQLCDSVLSTDPARTRPWFYHQNNKEKQRKRSQMLIHDGCQGLVRAMRIAARRQLHLQ